MFKFELIFTAENIGFLLKGAWLSLLIATFSLLVGLLLGTIIAWVRVGKGFLLKAIMTIYVEVFRGTPMLLQIAIFYLALPYLYQKISGAYLPVNPLIMGIIAIGLNSSAYLSEVIRASINSIDKGQWEAGKSLGLPNKKLMMKIILPQAYKRVIPPLVNEFITLIKDSSLVSTIGVVELMKSAGVLTNKYYDYFTPLICAAIIYLFMTLIISFVANRWERKLNIND